MAGDLEYEHLFKILTNMVLTRVAPPVMFAAAWQNRCFAIQVAVMLDKLWVQIPPSPRMRKVLLPL